MATKIAKEFVCKITYGFGFGLGMGTAFKFAGVNSQRDQIHKQKSYMNHNVKPNSWNHESSSTFNAKEMEKETYAKNEEE
jgi:hypothetical protein